MLRVFYGWARINKVRKAEAISVIFENRKQNEEKVQSFIRRMQDTVYVRNQTIGEQADGVPQNRMYTEFSIRMASKHINGDLEKALQTNFVADCNNVSETERETILHALREHYKMIHRS